VGLPALAGRGKELTSKGSMPDGVTIIDQLDEPSMGESSFKGRLPPLGGSPVTVAVETIRQAHSQVEITSNYRFYLSSLIRSAREFTSLVRQHLVLGISFISLYISRSMKTTLGFIKIMDQKI